MNEGAKIDGNTGGGVYVTSSGTFTMTGGTISGNSAYDGGGVHVPGTGTFRKQSGGIIYGSRRRRTQKYRLNRWLRSWGICFFGRQKTQYHGRRGRYA
jgi:hypothetical protein